MIIKDFQPIHFRFCTDDSECKCGAKGCDQRALLTDWANVQLEDISRFLSANLIIDGDFTAGTIGVTWINDGAGNAWSDATNQACTHANSQYLYQAQTLDDCNCYKLVFDLDTDLDVGCILGVYGWNGASYVLINSWTNISAQDDITHVFCPSEDFTRIAFRVSGDCEEGDDCIDDVELYRYDMTVNIYNCCTNALIGPISDCDITWDTDEEWVNIEFQWEDYVSDNACYRLQIEDAQLIVNGDFTLNIDNWTSDSNGDQFFSWIAGQASVTLSGGEESGLFYQDTELPPCQYELTFEITAGNNDFTVELWINDRVHTTFVTAGIKTVTLNEIGWINRIGFKYYNDAIGGGAVTYTLDDVSILQDIISDCLCVRDTHDCTFNIKAWNDEDTENFFFPTGFFLNMRVKGKMRNWNYPTEEDVWISSHGVNRLNYYRSEKVWDLQFERMPEYMWDALSTLIGLDNLEINGREFVKLPEDLDPLHYKGNDFAADGRIQVRLKTENRVK